MKEINKIIIPPLSTKSSRKRSWITHCEIAHEYPEFIDKIADILFDDDYHEETKKYARGVLEFLADEDYVSWKQFDSIFRIVKTKEEYFNNNINGTYRNTYKNIVSIKRNNLSISFREIEHIETPANDYEMDVLHEMVFGYKPIFEEEVEDGYIVKYSKKGKRYFVL